MARQLPTLIMCHFVDFVIEQIPSSYTKQCAYCKYENKRDECLPSGGPHERINLLNNIIINKIMITQRP